MRQVADPHGRGHAAAVHDLVARFLLDWALVQQVPPIVLDRAAALARLGFEDELFDELVQSLVERSGPMLADLRQAVERGDANQIEVLSHSIKGAAATLEANAVASAAHRLEMLARAGDLGEARVACRELQAAVDDLAAATAVGGPAHG